MRIVPSEWPMTMSSRAPAEQLLDELCSSLLTREVGVRHTLVVTAHGDKMRWVCRRELSAQRLKG